MSHLQFNGGHPARRRILYFQPNPVWGACEEYLALLVGGLDRARFSPCLLCAEGEGARPLLDRLPSDVVVERFSRTGLGGIRELVARITRFEPDLIHFNDPSPRGMVAARLAGVRRTVLTYHTPALRIRYNLRGRLLNSLALRQPTIVIAASKTNRDRLVAQYGFPASRVVVILHGLDPARFGGPFSRAAVREEFGIPESAKLLINVARLAPQKSQRMLLDAFDGLPEDLAGQTWLLIAGEGELRRMLEADIGKLRNGSRVRLAGYRWDVPRLLAAADVFVLSSRFEGLPFAVLEAMAMGKPIVATSVDGVRDAVVDGESGVLVPAGSPAALTDAVAGLLRQPARLHRLGAAARAQFERCFTLPRMLGEIQALYDRVLSGSA